MKVEIKPSQIVLKNALNKIGSYKVDINFHTEVSAQISIKIDKVQSK
jgi:ribosomal protein L9